MPNTLLSGSAGSGKSEIARRMVQDGEADVVVDFQSVLASLLQLRRQEDGRYPPRDERAARLMPMVEYLRATAIRYAVEAELKVVVTNSDGDRTRRNQILARLGSNAVEQVVEIDRSVAVARLSDPVTGTLSQQCESSISRWFDRL